MPSVVDAALVAMSFGAPPAVVFRGISKVMGSELATKVVQMIARTPPPLMKESALKLQMSWTPAQQTWMAKHIPLNGRAFNSQQHTEDGVAKLFSSLAAGEKRAAGQFTERLPNRAFDTVEKLDTFLATPAAIAPKGISQYGNAMSTSSKFNRMPRRKMDGNLGVMSPKQVDAEAAFGNAAEDIAGINATLSTIR